MASRAQRFRLDLEAKTQNALEDRFATALDTCPFCGLPEPNFADLAVRAVDVFAAALDDIAESPLGVPDIKRNIPIA